MVGETVVQSEGGVRRLVINYKGSPYGADVALYPQTMKDVVEKLQSADVDEVVLSEYYERIYNEEQTGMLKEIADLVTRLETDAVWSPSHLGRTTDSKKLAPRHDSVLGILNNLKSDPFKAYITLLSEIKTHASKANTITGEDLEDVKVYLQTLVFMRDQVEKLALIRKMKAYVTQLGSLPSDRGIYHTLFEVSIKPSFIGSRIFFTATENLELVDQYDVVGSKVYIYKHPDKVEYMYFVNPPEYTLSPDKYFLLEKTKEVVAGHRPGEISFMDIGQARQYFHKIYVATISDLAAKNNINLSVEEKEDLAEIVSRYTIGYGILEILLSDKELTDVFLDSPLGVKPIYLVHGKYGQCQTNIVFSEEEARAVVSRFRALSGRPFDEAHPILDFDLEDLQTRIAVIGRPLSLDGIAFAFRLHKVTPWTLPQFLDFKMFNSFTAGLLSFFVDAQASMLIVGSRGAGKCVAGDTLIQLADGHMEKIRDIVEPRVSSAKQVIDVGDGVCVPCDDLSVFNLTPELKIRPAPVSKVWRRTAPAHLYKVCLSSGKEIECTPEHPFFVSRDGLVLPLRADSLEQGEFVATPRIIPVENAGAVPSSAGLQQFSSNYNYLGCLSLIQRDLRQIAKKEQPTLVAEKTGLNYKSLCNLKNGVRNAVSGEEILKISSYAGSNLKEYEGKVSGVRTYHSKHHFKPEAFTRVLDKKFARFLGLLYGDGHVDEVEVMLTNVNDGLRAEFAVLAEELFGVKSIARHPKQRSPIAQISSKGLSRLLRERFGIPCGDKSSTQEMPQEIMKSENEVLAAFIQGYFDCDSSVSLGTNVIEFSTASKKMAEQLQYALLRFEIVARKKPKIVKGTTYWRLFIYGENCLAYAQKIGFGLDYKKKRLETVLAGRKFNSNVDVVPGARHFLQHTKQNYGFGKLSLDQRELGRAKARKLASEFVAKKPGDQKISQFQQLANSDIFWDKIESIEKIPSREPFVYDLTVDVTHSFVANGIIAHNTSLLQAMMQETPQNLRVLVQEDTQEIPVPALKKLGFNIQRLKTRPPLGKASESEISAEDALRIALRLGDSVLIVGEVRSLEAKALFEAMRVGAVGNVVMGTIHGETAYSIWDRIVNDLGVPTTSFKATDFAVVAAPIRFKGSLKRYRRLLEVTEIRKHWKSDPAEEGGLLQWLSFDANKDDLEFFENDLKSSEWLPKIQRNRGLKLEEIFEEVKARAETKWHLVELKRKYDLPRFLEAEYTIRAHNKYLLLGEKQREEFGSVDHQELLTEWKKWVGDTILREAAAQKQAEKKG